VALENTRVKSAKAKEAKGEEVSGIVRDLSVAVSTSTVINCSFQGAQNVSVEHSLCRYPE